MSCGCKSNKNSDKTNNITENKTPKLPVLSYMLKSIVFLLALLFLPIINIMIIWIMFRSLVLNKELQIKELLLTVANKFKTKDDDDDDDDYDELTEDDVVMMDVEDITNKSK